MPKPDRQVIFDELTEKPLNLLIIGGGILGAGIARDASMRKLRVGMIEQNDLASGTSGRSSRLIHGGLRYLGQGHIKLVREASREKAILHEIAHHLVPPVTFLFPAYDGTPYPRWKLSLGVKLYNRFTSSDAFVKPETLKKSETLEQFPFLKKSGLHGSVTYTDGQTLDSRLVIDTVLSAQNAGALISPQTEFISADYDGTLWNATVRDQQSGEEKIIQSHCIINATGPWMGKQAHAGLEIRPTKGIHLVFHHDDFPIPSALVIPAGKRILFAIPWGDRVVLGTTDTDYTGDLSNPTIDDEDIEYLLSTANQIFEGFQLTKDTVISGWAGICPLINDPRSSESDISRKHKIKSQKDGWWDVAGGKLTTYRLISEETVDKALDYLKMRARPCKTDKKPLLPASQIRVTSIIPPPVNMNLVTYFCEDEWALHLSDVMDRRTGWAQFGSCTKEEIRQIAQTMGLSLSWTQEQIESEIQAYEDSRPFKPTAA